MFSKIVVGTDGFGPASRAIARAVDLAKDSGAEVVVVHVRTPEQENAFGPNHPSAGPDAGRGVLDDVVKHHGETVKIKTRLEQGNPAEVLIDVAEDEDADLIVVGNKGMSQRFHVGTVPNRISHHAPCNVLIVHTVEEWVK